MMSIPTLISKCIAKIVSGLCPRCLIGLFLASTAWAQTDYANPYTITTLAGIPVSSADGTGPNARFSFPYNVAVDGAGNVYVADTGNNTIRKVTQGGVVTTLAGSTAVLGSADGTGSAARFWGPSGVAVDGSGNVYVADTNNNTIRKITSGGVVTTLAGTAGVHGSTDGTGSAALFWAPYGVAVDGSGNLYVSDSNNFTVRKITSGGVVTTLAGMAGGIGTVDGTGSVARFNTPGSVAVDGAGNLYVADTVNDTIRKITSGGVVTTLAGAAGKQGGSDGTGANARFFYPYGVAVDSSGNVYVADTGNNTIRKITSGGSVTTLAGEYDTIGSMDGTGTSAQFYYPSGVAVDGSGNVYVADTGNTTIRKITSGGVVTTLAGAAGATSVDGTGTAARFRYPQDIARDSSGNLYVADTGDNEIRKIAPGAVVTTLAGSSSANGSTDGTGNAARFNSPEGVAVDGSGYVYVADTANDTIRKITPGGTVTTLAGTSGAYGSADGTGAAARFNHPFSLTVDGSGNIYVAEQVNGTIRKITPGGVVSTLAGTAQNLGSKDGTGPAAQFNDPEGIAVDGSGNLYVADTNNHTIRKVTPAGVVTTVAGTAGAFGHADGTGAAARFYFPQGIAVDGFGNLFVADSQNNTIREITPARVVTTLAGTPLNFGAADGTGSAAVFNYPTGVAVDGSENIYVADLDNSTIRFGQAAGGGPAPTPTPTPLPGSGTARLINLSVRSTAGTGSQTLIGGYVIGGAGSKSVLVRGDGPALAGFGVTGVLPDPDLTLFNSASSQIATNSGWGGAAALSDAFMQVGAFPLSATSKDSAILATLGPGAYTAQISSTTGDSGVVLVEVYDADAGMPSTRFINLSARSEAGAGSQTLIAGFVVAGTGSETVLIRGDGPVLSSFGVGGVLSAPQLTLYDSNSKVIASNTGWSTASTTGASPVVATIAGATAAVFMQVGAFQLTAGSADSALIATLPPGSYTAQVTGVNATTGVALVEIYEVPAQ